MNIVIQQPGCLGDILFIQKLLHVLSKENKVYHPIFPIFWQSGVDQLINPSIFGPNISIPQDYSVYNCSDHIQNHPNDIMTSKYDGINIDWKDWSSYIKYERNYEREDYISNLLGVVPGEPFIITNSYYGMNKTMTGLVKQLPKDYDGKKVEMNHNIPGSKIFDWCWIFENAEEIHTVDTSILYVIETLNTLASKLIVHPRHYIHTEQCLKKLFSKNWHWVKYEKDEWKKVFPMEVS